MSDAVFKYDASADALYYRISRNRVVASAPVGSRVTVDIDEFGEAVGIEVLNPPGYSSHVRSSLSFSHPGFICGPSCPVDCPGKDNG